MTRETINAIGIVHTRVTVRKPSERLYFDLFIPEKAHAFTSIVAVAEVMKDAPAHIAARPWQNGTAGHLALRWNKPGNVFFMQKVDLIETFERDYLPCGLSHPGGAFWQSKDMHVCGKSLATVAIRIPWDCRHIRGAYLDVIDKARGGGNDYNVDIYLTYTNRP
jgi:hypothetical protein